MIFILLPTLHVWFVYVVDFGCLKPALKETYCVLPSLLNLAQGMESVLGKIISCRNNEAIGTLLPLFFSPSLKVDLDIPSGLKKSYSEMSHEELHAYSWIYLKMQAQVHKFSLWIRNLIKQGIILLRAAGTVHP